MPFFVALEKVHEEHENCMPDIKGNNLLASRKQHWKGQTIRERE
jgi:hypothetical protein